MLPRLPAPSAVASEAAGHNGIDDAHGHPAQLGQRERRGQLQHGTKLPAKIGDEVGHAGYALEWALGWALS